ncbi:MAG: hypothetical protein HKL96_01000 [Phycisphaerales bacterium]|nr:hypothetical protein [Phycisphaerales bacterium]
MIINGVPYDRSRAASSLRSIGYWLGAGDNTVEVYGVPLGGAPLSVNLQSKIGGVWHALFNAKVPARRKPVEIRIVVKGGSGWTSAYAAARRVPPLTVRLYKAVVVAKIKALINAIQAKNVARVQSLIFLSGKRSLGLPSAVRRFNARVVWPLMTAAIRRCRYVYACPLKDIRFKVFRRGIIVWVKGDLGNGKAKTHEANPPLVLGLYSQGPGRSLMLAADKKLADAKYITLLWTGRHWLVGQGFNAVERTGN